MVEVEVLEKCSVESTPSRTGIYPDAPLGPLLLVFLGREYSWGFYIGMANHPYAD